MRFDAIFRLIIAVFFASLPFLLAIQRGRQQQRRKAQEGPPPEGPPPDSPPPGKRRPVRTLMRAISDRVQLPRSVFVENDEDLREAAPAPPQPVPVRPVPPPRHRESPTGKVRITGLKTEPVRVPEKRRRGRTAAEEAFSRIEARPLLQRAILYREILDEPRALRPVYRPGMEEEQ